MSEASRAATDPETPVNPYTLLPAVNRASETAHTAWLIFLLLMTYLTIAVAGVTHKDLLLDAPVSLPLLQVEIPIVQFFRFAPVLLVMLHLGLIAQLVLLARETIDVDKAIRLLEVTDQRAHPLRLELDNFFFVQALAGPKRSILVGALLHAMSWLTIAVLPVVLLLFIQVSFLPYHDVTVTWIHRTLLMIDIVLLVTVGIFLTRAETSFFAAVNACVAARPMTIFVTSVLFVATGAFALLVATVPGEPLDRFAQSVMKPARSSTEATATKHATPLVSGFVVPFFGVPGDGSLFGLFHRNLVVTDTNLSRRSDRENGETLTLRGRDLKFARLDRSRLDDADLTGADLTGASFEGASLRQARLGCIESKAANGQTGAVASCVAARGADFRSADLEAAVFAGADLTDALLTEAKADRAVFRGATLRGTRFSDALLSNADFSGGVDARGASFVKAALQGARFDGSNLVEADLSSAQLTAASFDGATLEGARLGGADLTAATFRTAKLHAADLTGARIVATEFSGAALWGTAPPLPDPSGLADFREIMLAEASDDRIKELSEGSTGAAPLDGNPDRGMAAPLGERVRDPNWGSSDARRTWDSLIAPLGALPEIDYGVRLTSFLNQLMCRPGAAAGAIAAGISRRAVAEGFRGDIVAIYESIRGPNCSGGKSASSDSVDSLARAADARSGM